MDDGSKYDVEGERSKQNAFENAAEQLAETMKELGTEGMTVEQILGAPQKIYAAPRKKHTPYYRSGYTKNKGVKADKAKRVAARQMRRTNRRG